MKSGAIVDASAVDKPLNSKGKTVTEDSKDEGEVELSKDYSVNADKDAAWLQKRSKYRFSYQKASHYSRRWISLGGC